MVQVSGDDTDYTRDKEGMSPSRRRGKGEGEGGSVKGEEGYFPFLCGEQRRVNKVLSL